MAIIDIILIIILIGFFISGFTFGLIRTVGSLVGTIAGIYLASLWYLGVAEYLEPLFWNNANLSRVICFILILFVVDIIITTLFYLIHKLVGWLPIIKSLNKFGGAIFGVLKGILFLSIIIYVASFFPWWGTLTSQLEKSFIAVYSIDLIDKVLPFVSRAVDEAKNLL